MEFWAFTNMGNFFSGRSQEFHGDSNGMGFTAPMCTIPVLNERVSTRCRHGNTVDFTRGKT